MLDVKMTVDGYLLKGCCCTEAIVRTGLELLGQENEQMANASVGLCLGMHAGLTCGALAGGALFLSLFSRSLAATTMIPALAEWFDSTYGMQYGSVNCEDIAGERQCHKPERCKPLCIAVCDKCVELLSENELLPE